MDVQTGPDGRAPPQKKPKTKYPKIFQCTGYGDCKMTFTRSEHLARHIRKHTGERPFRCHCNRTFSRLDNLRQHIQTVHANEHHILRAPPPPPLTHASPPTKPEDMAYDPHRQHPGAHQQQHPPPPPMAGAPGKHRPKPIDLTHAQHHQHQHQHQHHDHGDQMAVDSPPTSPGTATLPYAPGKMGVYSPTSPYHQHGQPNGGHPNGHHPNGGYQHQQQQQHMPGQHPSQNGWYGDHPLPAPPPPPAGSAYQYPPYASDPALRSYRSTAGLSTSSTASISSGGGGAGLRASVGSNISSPVYPSSKTSSWLSNVLCENEDPDRPHTWGPSHNRYSTATDDGETASIASGRSSVSNLVSITESAHISSPPPPPPAGHHQQYQSQQQQQQNHNNSHPGQLPPLSSLVNGTPADARPQLSQNRSYTKNLILPRPDSFPPPKGYVLPMADTRPPALPPAGQVVPIAKNKPLPPLPAEAQAQSEPSKDGQGRPSNGAGAGMDMLIQAAGV